MREIEKIENQIAYMNKTYNEIDRVGLSAQFSLFRTLQNCWKIENTQKIGSFRSNSSHSFTSYKFIR